MFASAGFSPAEMNAFSITITTEGASFAGDGSRITNLMPRITTVTANGGFSSTQNKVRIYYRPEELNNTAPAAAIMSGWVKYSGSAGDIIADINNDGLLEAAKLAFLTPDAAGIEDGIHYVEFHNLCSFSSFAYISSTASITSTLPVDMLHFTAVANGAATFLQWTTTAEQQNKGFTVERSVDGGNWNKIGFVASKAFNGYSSSNQYYKFTDAAPVKGINFYRLKQTDLDGTEVYSAAVRVDVQTEKTNLQIYPNPVNAYLIISGLSGNNRIKILNTAGQQVMKTISSAVTEHSKSFHLVSLPRGVYILTVINDKGITETLKFFRE